MKRTVQRIETLLPLDAGTRSTFRIYFNPFVHTYSIRVQAISSANMTGRSRKRRRFWSKRALRRELSTGRSNVSLPIVERGPNVHPIQGDLPMIAEDLESEEPPMPATAPPSNALHLDELPACTLFRLPLAVLHF